MNFDILINFLANLGFEFTLISISKTWFSDQNSNNDLHIITNYSSIHQTRISRSNGGGLIVFVHKI